MCRYLVRNPTVRYTSQAGCLWPSLPHETGRSPSVRQIRQQVETSSKLPLHSDGRAFALELCSSIITDGHTYTLQTNAART